MRFSLLVLALVLAACVLSHARREAGALLFDGVPEVPRRMTLRAEQYTHVRIAAFFDWDPVGDGMLVGTRFGNAVQVHRVTTPGGDRRQLTFFPEPVASAIADPKAGGGFLFRSDVGGGERHQYYWFDLGTGSRRLLTDGASRNESLRVASAGGRYAFASTRRNGRDFDLWILEGLDAARARLLKPLPGRWGPLDWSEDDGRILLRHFVSAAESHLHVLEVATGEMRPLGPNGAKVAYGPARFSRRGPGVYYASDEGSEFRRLVHHDLATGRKEILTPDLSWDVQHLAVSRDGTWLAYTVNAGGASALYLAAAARPREAVRIELPVGVVSGLRFDRAGRRLGFTFGGATAPGDAYSVDVASRQVTRWTFSETGGLDPATFVAPELIEYPTFDGRRIPAWYYRPRGGGRFPVIVSIHGGPESQARPRFTAFTQYVVNELGAALVLPNVRGSIGYGKTYLALDDGYRREDAVKDIGKLLDWIATRPELDPARVAVAGGSYGGYMVLASLSHFGDRLACGVEIVGISNFLTFLRNTAAYRRDLRRAEYGDERDPKMRAFLTAISPSEHAHKIRRPLLVAQGANDPRVPASEAEQIVRKVRAGGTPVWYLLARNEGHGFRKKANQRAYLAAMALFLERCLKGSGAAGR
jgi:dipeptidyl aminopeptidase/acylaminoacyl peptidase